MSVQSVAGEPQASALRSQFSDLPQVRFQVAPEDDESLPSIIARSAREHVLPQISTVLFAAGIKTYNPAALLWMDQERLPQLAHVLRQPEGALRRRVGVRRGKTTAFGELVFPFGTLETKLRRIGPFSLSTDPHHRSAWLNKLLPCCPVHGEFLVSQCDACGEALRWLKTWGIEFCESCRSKVSASPLSPLRGERLRNFRLISELMSFEPRARARTLRQLPQAAHGYAPEALAMTAIQMIGLLNGRDGLGGDLKAFFRLNFQQQAAIVCAAGEILRDWPNGLREAFRQKVEMLGSDHEQFFLTWRSLKRFATPKLAGEEKARMVAEGLPDLESSIWHTFTSDGAVYSTQETVRVLGVPNARVRRLSTLSSMVHMTKPSRYRGNRQFKAEAINALRKEKDASKTFASITESTGLPTYALEQLASVGRLEFRDSEAMAVAYERQFVSRSSFTTLKDAIGQKRRRGRIPKDARPVSECARLLGGGEKPWHLIVEALIDGALPFWAAQKIINVRHVMVLPRDMLQFLGKRFDHSDCGFAFSKTYAKREAVEVLTIDTPLLDAVSADLGLDFRTLGRAKEIDKSAILKVARDIVSNAELGEHWGIKAKSVRHDPRVENLTRMGYGWRRQEAVDQGLIPRTI